MSLHLKGYQKSITLIKTGRLKQNNTNTNTSKKKRDRRRREEESNISWHVQFQSKYKYI